MGQCTSVHGGLPQVPGRGKARQDKSRKSKSMRRNRGRDAHDDWGNEEEDDLKNTARTVDSDEISEEDNENERSGVLEGIVNIRTELEGEEEDWGGLGAALDPMKSLAEELLRCEEGIEFARKALEQDVAEVSQVRVELGEVGEVGGAGGMGFVLESEEIEMGEETVDAEKRTAGTKTLSEGNTEEDTDTDTEKDEIREEKSTTEIDTAENAGNDGEEDDTQVGMEGSFTTKVRRCFF